MNATTNNPEKTSWLITSSAVNQRKVTGEAIVVLDCVSSSYGLVTQLTSGLAVVDNLASGNEPIFFEASKVHSACFGRGGSTKISILTPRWQIDLDFTSVDMGEQFIKSLRRRAQAVCNDELVIYDISNKLDFTRADFSLAKRLRFRDVNQELKALSNSETSEWSRLYATGQFTDFTIFADKRKFLVHRACICVRSEYFNTVCNGRFAEATDQSITLPEKAHIVALLLDELYGVSNSTTGSVFAGFALQSEAEKDVALTDLLELFIAADKYNLEAFKCKVVIMISDRLPFVQDMLTIINLAIAVYGDGVPEHDCGLRQAVVAQIKTRHTAVVENETAWNAFSGNKVLLKAFHRGICYGTETENKETAPSLSSAPPERRKRT